MTADDVDIYLHKLAIVAQFKVTRQHGGANGGGTRNSLMDVLRTSN